MSRLDYRAYSDDDGMEYIDDLYYIYENKDMIK